MTAVPTQSHYYYSESLSVITELSWNISPKQNYVSNFILQEISSIGVLHRKESIFTFWRQKLNFYSCIVLPLDSSQNHFVEFLFVLELVSLLLLFLFVYKYGFLLQSSCFFWAIYLHDQEYETATTGTVHHCVSSRWR